MPTIEDKVLQRAIAMLLEPIFEQDFKCFSYGFRPGRSAHQALACIWSQCTHQGIQWILEVDIRKYFDTLKKEWLRKFLDRRVRDGVIRRLIGKWLKAGVWEKGQLSYPEDGTPQGGVISPLLSNIYLHEVLDCWYVEEVKPRMKGRTFLVRFADDFILGFEKKEDAEKVYRVLFKRFEKYGLSLHPEKTRLVPFGRPVATQDDPTHGSETGNLRLSGLYPLLGQEPERALGHSAEDHAETVYARTQSDQSVVSGKPARTDAGASGAVGPQTQRSLWVLRHYWQLWLLQRFRWEVIKIWRKWLARRGDPKGMSWERMNKLLDFFYLPEARVVHSIYAAKP